MTNKYMLHANRHFHISAKNKKVNVSANLCVLTCIVFCTVLCEEESVQVNANSSQNKFHISAKFHYLCCILFVALLNCLATLDIILESVPSLGNDQNHFDNYNAFGLFLFGFSHVLVCPCLCVAEADGGPVGRRI